MPTIYDNIDKILSDDLRYTLKESYRSDFCVGYFNLRGWKNVTDIIEDYGGEDDSCCRLIVGMQRPSEDLLKQVLANEKPGLVDQQKLVLDYYYSSHMGKSNSIKYVLPAVLTESEFLKQVYSQPYSGLSIQNTVLYVEEHGIAVNPYKLLDPLGLDEIPEVGKELEGVVAEDQKEAVADGGMAMMAWSRMQFPDVGDEERDRVFKSLLRYCELDTLAMAMIHQHWASLR